MNRKIMTPISGDLFTDYNGRRLRVLKVDIGDSLGRNVQGLVRAHNYRGWTPYSCTMEVWESVWRDKVPPTPRENQTLA